jgi:hypothetical protein
VNATNYFSSLGRNFHFKKIQVGVMLKLLEISNLNPAVELGRYPRVLPAEGNAFGSAENFHGAGPRQATI